MRAIAESIKRLYKAGKLTKEDLLERKTRGTITEQEYEEILNSK